MTRTLAAWTVVLGLTVLPQAPQAGQVDSSAELPAFAERLDQYVQMHRRLEGPLPPLMAANDMGEVLRLISELRGRIRTERGSQAQGAIVPPAMAVVLRNVIARTLTLEDIAEVAAELEEHTPPAMPDVRVNEPLPDDAPFVMIAPQLLRALPSLPPELRYMALSKALLIWDSHANLVVEVVPGLFDPLTYRKKTLVGKSPDREVRVDGGALIRVLQGAEGCSRVLQGAGAARCWGQGAGGC